MNQEECAAVKRKREREIHGYKNIAGCIVPNTDKRPDFPIVKNSDLSPRLGTAYSPAGISSTDKNLKSPSGSAHTSNLNKIIPSVSSSFGGSSSASKGVQKDKDPIAAPKMENVARKVNVTQSTLLLTLNRIREPVLDYQEARGVPRNVDITFYALVTSLVTQAYTAGITILVMLWNLMPLVDGFIYFIRFLLDKLIDIVQTGDNKERAIKAGILLGELTVISILIFFIFGLIFMPVYVLVARLVSKIFSMVAW